jgi:quercetin dioxygenase-like cupin family protein
MLFTNSLLAQNMPRRWIAKLAAVGFVMAAGTGAAMAQVHEHEHGEQVAEGAPAPVSTPLLESSTHGDGVPIVYPKGQPLITARITEIPPGAATPRHRHTIPLFVYILEGELTLHGEDGSTRLVKQGDAFMEATDWHFGRNEGSAKVRLLAVYPGEVGTPLSIRADQ